MTTQMIRRSADDLLRRRLALGYSRERLGAAAGGISSATVKRVERGLVSPHPATLTALAQALGCEVSDLSSGRHREGATRA
jgi:transcriptional regulator with XRE-family HTH domain